MTLDRHPDTIANVNPQMVILGRQARGLTQTELAEQMGVAQSTVSKIEAGVVQPTGIELTALSSALDVPPRFFSQDRLIPGPGLSELFHRKRQKLGAKALHRIHAQAAIRLLNIQDLLRSWPKEDEEEGIPKMPIDQYEDDPEKIARTIRALWQIPPGPIFNVTEVVERSGGIVIVCKFETQQIDAFSRRWDDVPPSFFMNAALLPDRWRWTLAHELGHMVMHISVPEPDKTDRQIEDEADRFAGEFLAPAYELKPQLWGLTFTKLAGLKRYWKISMQSILMRARHLGVLGESQFRAMFIQLSKAGYRLREPAELDPPSEPPQLMKKIVQHHVHPLGYSDEQLMEALNIGPHDLHDLATPTPRLRLVDPMPATP